MEAVPVLHQELPRAEHPEARPELVAELGLDLVNAPRQVLVRGQRGPDQLRHGLLRRGRQRRLAAVAVVHHEEVLAIRLPPPGLLPERDRLQARQAHLHHPGGVELLAEDRLDLAEAPQPQRQIPIRARAQPADQPRAEHQPVRGHLRIGGGLPQGGAERPGPEVGHGGAGAGRSGRAAGARPRAYGSGGPAPGGQASGSSRAGLEAGPQMLADRRADGTSHRCPGQRCGQAPAVPPSRPGRCRGGNAEA